MADVNDMTNGERVAYAHGRVKSDMDDIRAGVEELHRGVRTAYIAWLTVLIAGLSVLIVASLPFFIFPDWQWYKFVYIAVSIIVFLVARLVSFHRIRAVFDMAHIVDNVIVAMSNTQTLHLGFEHMQQENKDRAAEQDAKANRGQ